MPPLPSISIVIPSYNQGQFLEEAILSLLGQEYPHLEIIVMDGDSTDDSLSVIQRYSDRLHYWVSEPDEGQTDAIMKGFSHASGEIFFWLAADDFLLPGALHTVGEFFAKNPAVEVVTGGCYYTDDVGRPITKWGNYTLGVPATYNRLRYYEQDGISCQSTFFRRTAYEAVGGVDSNIEFIMDLDLYARLAMRKRFARLPRLLAGFRIHEGAKSSRIQHVREEEQEAFWERHGVADLPVPLRKAAYWRYRIPSLVRKGCLRVAQAMGSVRKPQKSDAREWAAHHKA